MIAAVLLGAALLAAPRLPGNPDLILERLPERSDSALRRSRAELRRDPANLALALAYARSALREARRASDPRYAGYAQSALGPWWTAPRPPEPVLVLRATLRQYFHDFPAALADLEAALALDPADGQAWVTLAAIRQVRGEPALSRSACAPLLRLSSALVAATCIAAANGLSGDLARSAPLLRTLLDRAATADTHAAGGPHAAANAGEKVWALSVLADLDERAGNAALAEADFRAALAAAEPDAWLLGAWADFLLDHRREAEVVELLRDRTRADALLLRLAIAGQRLGRPDAGAQVEMLRDRFATSRLRGDTAHRREEARFTLELLGEPRAALALAQANWEVQREPADARLLLEAAVAAGDAAAARPVLDHLDRTRLEDVKLAALRSRLRGAP